MFDHEFSDRIRLTLRNGESIELDQRRAQIRENEKGLMALSYVAPVFEVMDIESFFDGVLTSEKLSMNIADTGDFTVSFRGIVEGEGKISLKILTTESSFCRSLPIWIQERIFRLRVFQSLKSGVRFQNSFFLKFTFQCIP